MKEIILIITDLSIDPNNIKENKRLKDILSHNGMTNISDIVVINSKEFYNREFDLTNYVINTVYVDVTAADTIVKEAVMIPVERLNKRLLTSTNSFPNIKTVILDEENFTEDVIAFELNHSSATHIAWYIILLQDILSSFGISDPIVTIDPGAFRTDQLDPVPVSTRNITVFENKIIIS